MPVAELAYFDPDSRAWVLEDVDYTVWVGPSSRELPLRTSFRVQPG